LNAKYQHTLCAAATAAAAAAAAGLLFIYTQGGGFCGARTKALDLDLSAYDGLQLRVKGDGQIFKFNIKTVRSSQTHSDNFTGKCRV
jgi:hypothetical protein